LARRSLTKSTHNAALEVVAGTPQEDLLLYHLLLGRHFPSFCAIVTCGKVKECAMTAVKQRLRLVGKCRASCGCSKEGCRIEKNEGYGSEGRHARSAQVRQRAQPVWIPTLTWNQDPTRPASDSASLLATKHQNKEVLFFLYVETGTYPAIA